MIEFVKKFIFLYIYSIKYSLDQIAELHHEADLILMHI